MFIHDKIGFDWGKNVEHLFPKGFTSLLFTCCFYRLKCTVVAFFFFENLYISNTFVLAIVKALLWWQRIEKLNYVRLLL